MEQIADLSFYLGMDAQQFKDEVPRVMKILNDASGASARSEARVQRFMEKLAQSNRQAVEGANASTSAAARQQQAVETTAQSYAQMAQRVEASRQQAEQYSRRLKEEAAQSQAVSMAQDKATQAFFRQIEGVKQLETGLQKLNNIQVQLRQSRDAGNISQGDYLTLLSTTRARVNALTQAENQSQAAKTRFLASLKSQVTQQKLSNTEMLRYKAAELGVSNAADIYIRKMENAAKSTHSLSLNSAAARREIGVLIGELARGNFGALRGSGITLANRSGLLDQLVSLRGLAIGGVVGGVASAVYGLAKAWYEGSQEAVEFNKQLILTGNYAGKSAGQLQEMAKSLSGNGITEHDAAAAFATVVGTGAFKSNQIATVTKAALDMQNATGQAIDETIKNFQKLAQSPTQASLELNKQLHYLTSSQYEYIASLESRGYKESAAASAQSYYAQEMETRAKGVVENLGSIERAIKTATGWWNNFWDAALDIGRARSLENVISEQKTLLAEIEANEKNGFIGRFKNNASLVNKQGLITKLKVNEQALTLQNDMTKAVDEARKADENRTESLAYQNNILSKNMSWQQKRLAALNTLWQKVSLSSKDWSKEQRTRAVAQINADNKSLKTAKTPKPKAYHDDEATRLLTQYSEKQSQLQGQIDNARLNNHKKLTEAENQYLALESRIAGMKDKTLTAADKSILAHRQALELALKQNAAKEKELNQQNAVNALKAKGVQIDRQSQEALLQAKQQQALSIGSMGMGDKVRARYQEELNLRQEYQRQLAQLERDSEVKGTKGTPEYAEVTQKLQASLNERLAALKSYYAEEDAAQANWVNGVTRAIQNMTAENSNAAKMGEQMFNSAFGSMSDALGEFVTTGKLNTKSLVSSMLADFAKMEARLATSKILSMLFSWGASAFGGWNVSALHDGTGGVPMPPKLNALGGVYASAGLSAYSGQIVNRPTYFAFAKGAGVMGEAGPEAILPLRRGSNGKLGVVAAGMGGMAMFAPQYNINIQNDASNGQIGPEALNAVYNVGKKAAADFISQQRRDGGQLSGAY